MKKYCCKLTACVLLTSVLCGCFLQGCESARDTFELVAYEMVEPTERIKSYMLDDGGFNRGPDYNGAYLHDTYYASLITQIAMPEYVHNYGKNNVPMEFQYMDLTSAELHNCWYYTKLFAPYLSENKKKVAQITQNSAFKDALAAKNVANVIEIYFAIDIANTLGITYDKSSINEYLSTFSHNLAFPTPNDAKTKNDLLFAYSTSMNLCKIGTLIGNTTFIPTEKIVGNWNDYEDIMQQALAEGTLDIISFDNYLFLAKQFKMDTKIDAEQAADYVRSLHNANGGYNYIPNRANDAFSCYFVVKIAQEYSVEIDLKSLKNRLMRYETANGVFGAFSETASSASDSYYALMSLRLLDDSNADKLIANYLAKGNFEDEIDRVSIYKMHLENAIGVRASSAQINAALSQIVEEEAKHIFSDPNEGNLLYLLNITLDLVEDSNTIDVSVADKIKERLTAAVSDKNKVRGILKNIALKKLGFEYSEKTIKTIQSTILEYTEAKEPNLQMLSLLAYAAQSSGMETNAKTTQHRQ